MVVLGPPPLRLLAGELPRAAGQMARLPFAWRDLKHVPRGDGRPVLILPGLFNSDRSNVALRRYLCAIGYDARGWGLGRNLGQRTIGAQGDRLFARVADVHRETGRPVTLIGVSLGGIMARIAAHRHPDEVRGVVTISAPFAGPPTATNVWRAYEMLSGARIDDPAVRAFGEQAARVPPVPTLAIWSARDGVVNGAICHDPAQPHAEIASSHIWVQFNPATLRAVARGLAAL